MGQFEHPAVVIGGGVNGLGIIRNLGRNRVDVYCVVDVKDVAVHSRYCRECFVFPGVGHDLQKLRIFLTKLADQLDPEAVLFPTSDISILNVSSLMGEVDNYLISISEKEVLETVVKKRKFYHSLIANGVPHPLTLFPDIEEFKDVTGRLSLPAFVKPSMSQIFSQRFGKKGFVVSSERELYQCLRLMEKHRMDVMVQEIVPGLASQHYFIDGYLDKNSKPMALFARRRLRMWPLSFGNSTACVSVPIAEVNDLKETIVRYLTSIGFRGIFSAEFKIDPRDNVGKLLEVNARSWWYNSFPSACGVNIILMAYLEAIGEKLEPIESYEVGTNLIYFTEDLNWLLAMLARKQLPLNEWFSSLAEKKDWVVWARDDLRPFIMNLLRAGKDLADREKIAKAIRSQ